MKKISLFVALLVTILISNLASAQCAELERVNGDTAVYYINGGVAYHVPDGDTFQALEFDWNKVANVGSISVSARGWMPSIKDSNVLVQGSGPRVYVMRDGQLHHVTSPAVFEREFGKSGWGRVKRLPDALLNRYPQGSPIS